MKQFSFPKSKRLKTNRQFRAVITHKACVTNSLLRVSAAPNDLGFSRLGVSLARAVGPAIGYDGGRGRWRTSRDGCGSLELWDVGSRKPRVALR